MEPYLELGVSLDADDAEIRQAYLGLLRKYPPDTAPQRFQRLSAAYETIKDKDRRVKYSLNDCSIPADTPFQTFLSYQGRSEKREPLKYDQLKEFLIQCAKMSE